MPSPFPGMDPYLEDPELWSGFHATFIGVIQEQLADRLRPNYFVRIEERVYVTQPEDPAYRIVVPDVSVLSAGDISAAFRQNALSTVGVTAPIPVIELEEVAIHERRIEVLDRRERQLVAVIEMLCPTNKVHGSAGRQSFLQKRREIYASAAHWLEIDLLRDGHRSANLAATADAEYQVFLSRAGEPRTAFAWPIRVTERLPTVAVPLRQNDADVALDLQRVFQKVYDRCGYDMDLDYASPPRVPLVGEIKAWAERVVKAVKSAGDTAQ